MAPSQRIRRSAKSAIAQRQLRMRRIAKKSPKKATASKAAAHSVERSSSKAAVSWPVVRTKPTIASIVAAFKSKVRPRRAQNKSVATKMSVGQSATEDAAPIKSMKPIKRRSVVRKPMRAPSLRSRRKPTFSEHKAKSSASFSGKAAQKAVDVMAYHPTRFTHAEVITPSIAPSSHPAHLGQTSKEAQFVIPNGYGDDRIVLMVKDPWWLYAYWEIRQATERAAHKQLLPHEVAGLKSILRVYDVSGKNFPAQGANSFFDISLSGMATNWYINANSPNCEFIVEIGLLTNTNRFILLARSNRVKAPRNGPSDRIDEEWACTDQDYWKLFGATAGIGMGASAGGLKELLERKLISSGAFSGAMFSPMKAQKARGFWLWVDAELIVYGATDPKAAVSIQGQPIKLRPDGTFSTRMALPDGVQVIPVEATSPDGEETRNITPTVTRQTSGHVSMPARTRSRDPKAAQGLS